MTKTINLDDAGIVAAMRAAADEIQAMLPENDVRVSISVTAKQSYSKGVGANVHVGSKLLGEYGETFTGETIAAAISAAKYGIREKLEGGRAKRVRAMALAIIEATADHDVCTDAHLRVAGFDAVAVADLHAEASAQANAITDGRSGTYAVTFVSAANVGATQ